VQASLAELDTRVDAAALKRVAELKRKLTAERGDLGHRQRQADRILSESQSVGGGLAYAMLSRITDRFYELVVQSDVGLVDVAWGLKDERTAAVSKLINQQKLELKSVEDDFHSLLEEEKVRRGFFFMGTLKGFHTLPRWCAASKARRLPTRLIWEP